ncbi:MAG: coniferyl aldehyde dehydrogenase [Gammaproteobacteria bacterium]|nr:MAG: coniferyl aldehyde dehydrogenase [Gammaproteobacteria bacterium]
MLNSAGPTGGSIPTVLAAQRAAGARTTCVSAEVREDRLDRLIDALLTHEKGICAALMADFGYRSECQSRFAEVVTSIKPLRIARRSLRRWMRPERRKVDFPFNLAGAKAEIHYQPLGCVGLISPWNFPVNLTVVPLAGILAAGNRAMIKPSELTPATAELMHRMFASAFDAEEVAVINGGAETGKAFAALPFDHLVYTGGAGVAREIMRAAAANLVPLTLELGGKSPVIVSYSAELRVAARQTLFGKLFNAGQICLAPDYLFIERQQLEPFVDALRLACREMLPPARAHVDYVSVVSARHKARLTAMVDEARAAGAGIVELGPIVEPAGDTRNLMPITLIIEPDERCAVSKEEIFGPLLVIRTYRHLDEVIAHINAGPRPLALYYFGSDTREQQRILSETCSGGVTINDVIMHYTADDLPFGGVGTSGMGAYHGVHGFRQFSHARAVYRQAPVDLGRLLRPPYGTGFRKLSDLLIRFS